MLIAKRLSWSPEISHCERRRRENPRTGWTWPRLIQLWSALKIDRPAETKQLKKHLLPPVRATSFRGNQQHSSDLSVHIDSWSRPTAARRVYRIILRSRGSTIWMRSALLSIPILQMRLSGMTQLLSCKAAQKRASSKPWEKDRRVDPSQGQTLEIHRWDPCLINQT